MVTHNGYAGIKFSESNFRCWLITGAQQNVFAEGKMVALAKVASSREKSLTL
jgi:hypothetical protein